MRLGSVLLAVAFLPQDVCRHRFADGKNARAIELRKDIPLRLIAPHAEPFKDRAYRSGLPTCTAQRERIVKLDRPAPARFRGATFYFGAHQRDGTVFILDTDSLKAVPFPATLASAEFARALGVNCRDARVTTSKDGLWSTIREEPP